MCNSQNEQLIRDVVAEKVQSGSPFTIWDITNEARKRGATEQHYQMKSVVTGMSAAGELPGYDCTVIQTPTGQARCYHPLGMDISGYVNGINGGQPAAPSQPSPSASSAPTPSTVATGTAVADPADDSDTERKVSADADGRLNISPSILSRIGLAPGDKAQVGVDDGALVVKNGVPLCPVASYVVQADGRVRINPDVLVMSKVASPSGIYKVSVIDNCAVPGEQVIEIQPV